MEIEYVAWIIGGIFAFLACGMSLFLIIQHLRHYFVPEAQRHVVRILAFVPIYAADSFLSLLVWQVAIYLDVIRDCYGAYVLWSFYQLCVQYLQGEEVMISVLENKNEDVPHPWPFCCLKFRPTRQFIINTKRCILQYVLFKPLLAIIAVILQFAQVYDVGHFRASAGYLWITVLDNCSVTVSLYALALFYMATREQLADHRPLWKFACVKAVVFFSWWQGVLIAILGAAGAIQATKHLSQQAVAIGIQDLLICIEMFLIAIAHHWAFSYQEFASHHLTQTPLLTSAHPTYELQRIASSTHHVLNFTEDVSQVNQTFSSQARKRGDDVSSEDEA